MKKTINQLIENFKALLDMRPVRTNENKFTLHDLYKAVKDEAIIFDISEKNDEPVETLFNQAILTGEIVDVYKGYSDDTGHLHIVNAPNLKLLIEESVLFNRNGDFQLARHFHTAVVKIFYIESFHQDSERRKEIGKILNISGVN
jgi:hypothetical protein